MADFNHPGVAIALELLTRRPPRARCSFESRCRHCDYHRHHATAGEARTSAAAHSDEHLHDCHMADWNGWHRP